MRLIRTTAVAASAALAVAIASAPQAAAYDRDAYEYAAGHMIDVTDIPKVLGDFDARLSFSASPGNRVFLCYVPSEDPNDDGKDISVGKPFRQYSANYDAKKETGPSVQVQVLEYATATAAIKAFGGLKTKARGCNGTGSTTWTNDDGTTSTNSWNVTTSTVPGVAVVGVASIGITQDNMSTSSDSDDRYVNDNYVVYSLVNDAIISTSYFANGTTNLTKQQRRAVDQVAFNAITEWLD